MTKYTFSILVVVTSIIGLGLAVECPNSGTHFFEDPDDCSGFYKCKNSFLTHHTCPKNTYWDSMYEECSRNIPTSCESDKCPQTGTSYRKHPSDCRKFIKCKNGVETEMHCPHHQHWNDDSEECDHPSTAGCVKSDICENDELHYVKHPVDCSKFIECEDGIGKEVQCPRGLHWDESEETCNDPLTANCISRPPIYPTSLPPHPMPPHPMPPHPMPPHPIPPEGGPIQPPQGYCRKQYAAHPAFCTKFIQCSNGMIYILDCPDGLHFNERENVCDWPKDAHCY